MRAQGCPVLSPRASTNPTAGSIDRAQRRWRPPPLVCVPLLLVALPLLPSPSLALPAGSPQSPAQTPLAAPSLVACAPPCAPAPPPLRWVADLELLQANWPGPGLLTLEDAFRVQVTSEDFSLVAGTHLFDERLNVIPYDDRDGGMDAAGVTLERGDAVLAEYFPPGEIGFAIKHHRPSHRSLELEGEAGIGLLRDLKLLDTHMGIVVGVKRAGQPGALTLNNPQGYDGGRFGSAKSAMLFLRPVYPAYLGEAERLAFRNNVRTMLVGFNAVSSFPLKYDGGDPLGGYDQASVLELAAMMVRTIAGDETAAAWFRKPENLIYCAELAHIAASAGLLAPLNAKTFEPLVGAPTWAAFRTQVEEHNRGRTSAFTELNQNEQVSLIELAVASEELAPVTAYAPPGLAPAPGLLAFRPMTTADVLDTFLQAHVPRRAQGEGLAAAQARLLEAARKSVLVAVGLEQVELTDERRQAFDRLYDRLVAAVGRSYAAYSEYRAAIEPLLREVETVTVGLAGPGDGLYVPPSLFHLEAQGLWPHGLLGVRYVGHGLHLSLLRRGDAP